jgi:hypothetical protein
VKLFARFWTLHFVLHWVATGGNCFNKKNLCVCGVVIPTQFKMDFFSNWIFSISFSIERIIQIIKQIDETDMF